MPSSEIVPIWLSHTKKHLTRDQQLLSNTHNTMDVRLIRRPVVDLFSGRTQCLFAGNIAAQRCESTFRRTKKALNLKPESSFLLSKSTPKQDHIIFNPPASSPSVLHTPLKFLPKDDKRRQLFASATTSTLANSGSKLPPVARRSSGYQRHHLTEEDVKEIKRLRSSDPQTWTRAKLAKKYNCSSIFIGMCCEAPTEKVEAAKAQLEAVKARWGPKRRMAREDRVKRREAAYRDE